MTNTLRRYDVNSELTEYGSTTVTTEETDGDWVRWEDVTKLLARLSELEGNCLVSTN